MLAAASHANAFLMKNKIVQFAGAAVFASLACGCVCENHKPLTVHVDLSQTRHIEVDTTNMIRLEASDSSRIFGIDHLLAIDGKFVVASRNLLRCYDVLSGQFLGNIANYGPDDSDFSNISMIWATDDTVSLFDSNTRTVNRYLPDGTYLGKVIPFKNTSLKANQPPRLFFTSANGYILSVNGSTGGSTKTNPLISLYDSTGSFLRPVPGREVMESTYLMDGAYYDAAHDRLLIWEPLRDTVFAADINCIRPIYEFDFGVNKFPSEMQNLPGLALRAKTFNAGNNPPYATMLRYIQTNKHNLYFCFADSDGHDYIARYNENDGKTTIRQYTSRDGRYTQTTFFLLDGDSIRLELRDHENIESNPIIYTVSKNDLQ